MAKTKAQATEGETNDETAAAKAAPKMVKKAVLRVVCAKESFRRGGVKFSKGTNDIDLATLTAEQIASIKAEGQLGAIETFVDVPAE